MKKTKMPCENCGELIEVIYHKNRWVEWFKGECETCGYRFELKDTEFDYIQPDSDLFEMIYKYHPEREFEKNKKIHAWEEEKRKADLEKKYWEERYDPTQKHIRHKASERRAIEKEVLMED